MVGKLPGNSLSFDPADVLFVGLGKSAVGWYRCYLPAMFMGADWIGVSGEPPDFAVDTAQRRRPDIGHYEVVVFQQPRAGWKPIIQRLKSQGTKVVIEVDDYLHGIHKMPDHDFKGGFTPKRLKAIEVNFALADALICSTEFIARRYRRFNRNTHVCEIGLDLARYALTRPQRPTVNIGWSGGTGHVRAVQPWLEAVRNVMRRHENVCFVTIGEPFADDFVAEFGTRAITVPFTMIEQYPAAMTLFDVALAPAGRGNFFRGKSDLRWIEAGALGIPVIADPEVYWRIEDGVDGFLATTPTEAELQLELVVTDDRLRLEVGENVRRYVWDERGMKVAVGQWLEVLASLEEPAPAAGAEVAH